MRRKYVDMRDVYDGGVAITFFFKTFPQNVLKPIILTHSFFLDSYIVVIRLCWTQQINNKLKHKDKSLAYFIEEENIYT
jgi:hypothetical protein